MLYVKLPKRIHILKRPVVWIITVISFWDEAALHGAHQTADNNGETGSGRKEIKKLYEGSSRSLKATSQNFILADITNVT